MNTLKCSQNTAFESMQNVFEQELIKKKELWKKH